MNKELLDKLLMSFYDGQTTLEEEKQLMDFFTTATSLDEEYLADKELFIALSENVEQVVIPASLDDKLEKWLLDEASVQSIDIASAKRNTSIFERHKYLFSMVASFLLLLGGLFLFKTLQPEENKSLMAVELTLEESAEVTEQVLLLLSSKLNQSVGAVDQAQAKVNDVSRVMHKMKIK